MFPSSIKREFRHLHVVVVQQRQRNVQKSVMHVQSCCFAIAFLSFSLPSPSSLLKLPNDELKSDAAICKMIVHIMHFIVLLIVSSFDDDQFCCLLLGKLT